MMKNTSPNRNRALVSNPVRDEHRSSVMGPPPAREDAGRYLVPASSQGREHHQRHYSATRADMERLNVGSRNERPRSYHHAGGYSSKPYPPSTSSIQEEDFSYTGPREQFARDYPSRPLPQRDSYAPRERPVSVIGIPEYKVPSSSRRESPLPPPAPRQLDRPDRPDGGRSSIRPALDDDLDRGKDLPSRSRSTRQPVVHQHRDEGYASARDDLDLRASHKSRRDRVEEEDLVPRTRHRDTEIERDRDRERDYVRDRDRDRDRDRERDYVRERDRERDRDRERERDTPRESDRDRDRERDREMARERPKLYEESRYSDERRKVRSRDSSPEHVGMGKGVAVGLGGIAAAGLAGAAIKGSHKSEEASDSDSRREKRHRKHKHRDRDDEIADPKDVDTARDQKAVIPPDERTYDEPRVKPSRRDESASESLEDDHERRKHRRRKHRDRDELDADTVKEVRPATDDVRMPDRETAEELDEDKRHRRRATSRAREEDLVGPERRTFSPGEEADDRPRRVQLVEPEKKEEFKPKGILKKPRAVPFPEDPNPTREGVAPLKEKDATKDGIPAGARWTKISRVLVNPEALEHAHERFEERDDYVIVLRVITREEIQKFAEKTREIRGKDYCIRIFQLR